MEVLGDKRASACIFLIQWLFYEIKDYGQNYTLWHKRNGMERGFLEGLEV